MILCTHVAIRPRGTPNAPCSDARAYLCVPTRGPGLKGYDAMDLTPPITVMLREQQLVLIFKVLTIHHRVAVTSEIEPHTPACPSVQSVCLSLSVCHALCG